MNLTHLSVHVFQIGKEAIFEKSPPLTTSMFIKIKIEFAIWEKLDRYEFDFTTLIMGRTVLAIREWKSQGEIPNSTLWFGILKNSGSRDIKDWSFWLPLGW